MKVPNPDKHVGSRLRMRRRMLRMTQRKLGYKLDRLSSKCINMKQAKTASARADCRSCRSFAARAVLLWLCAECRRQWLRTAATICPGFSRLHRRIRLVRAFTLISDAKLRRSLVRLDEELGGESDS